MFKKINKLIDKKINVEQNKKNEVTTDNGKNHSLESNEILKKFIKNLDTEFNLFISNIY
jgi:hypothetical protein